MAEVVADPAWPLRRGYPIMHLVRAAHSATAAGTSISGVISAEFAGQRQHLRALNRITARLADSHNPALAPQKIA